MTNSIQTAGNSSVQAALGGYVQGFEITSSSRSTESSAPIGFSSPANGVRPLDRSKKGAFSSENAVARSSLRSILRECDSALTRILDNRNDLILRSNSFNQFHNLLKDLWDIRKDFTDSYAETVNSLQCIVRSRTDECFSNKEIEAIQQAMTLISEADEIDDEVANEVTVALLRGGLDVFRELD